MYGIHVCCSLTAVACQELVSPDGEQPDEDNVSGKEPVRHLDHTGTGTITLTAAQGSAVLENTALADIDLDTKMELVACALEPPERGRP